jgi:hypothetical protein
MDKNQRGRRRSKYANKQTEYYAAKLHFDASLFFLLFVKPDDVGFIQ